MVELVGNSWDDILQEEYHKQYFKDIVKFINKEYRERVVFPPKSKILRALNLTNYDNVKVVILGQDPYHGDKEANGLCFAVSDGIKLPPSLKNIYKELESDLGIPSANVGNLECWAREGVLLLNAVLTVEKDKPASHKHVGWEQFTDAIIRKLNEKEEAVVFILWGNFARSKKNLITNSNHYVIESTHPSPFSANHGFFGSRPFSRANNYLKSKGIDEIDWKVY